MKKLIFIISLISLLLLPALLFAAEDGAAFEDPRAKQQIPLDFADGKRDGKIYFIRIKHGAETWDKYRDGTQNLLKFLSGYAKCDSADWLMSVKEMQDKYMRGTVQPAFIYIYCDESFSLTAEEVNILKIYMDNGGFLFLDSPPVSAVRSRVAAELKKILPASSLTAIPKSSSINSFLFPLKEPGVGLNTLTQTNYGITRGGRYIVFYTMGNFMQFYSMTSPYTNFQYDLVQYQMGANVMLYAINKGDNSGVPSIEGGIPPDFEDGCGGAPVGFSDGKHNGKLYLMQIKHGAETWNKYPDGPQKLLKFMNSYYRCDSEPWIITPAELSTDHLNKGHIPPCLYIYCDETLSLTGEEADILKTYMDNGGFLFIDSPPSLAAKDKITGELKKILPNNLLTAIPKNSNINTFLFPQKEHGFGFNMLTETNYGIMQGSRYVVFYTMGNMSLFYSLIKPDPNFQYGLLQYTMGANVVLYAVNKGDNKGFRRFESVYAPVQSDLIAACSVSPSVMKMLGIKNDYTSLTQALSNGVTVNAYVVHWLIEILKENGMDGSIEMELLLKKQKIVGYYDGIIRQTFGEPQKSIKLTTDDNDDEFPNAEIIIERYEGIKW